VYVAGDVQLVQEPWSSLHWNVAVSRFDANVNVATLSSVGFTGFVRMLVFGSGTTVHPYVAGVESI
jgi:hypothetical protein